MSLFTDITNRLPEKLKHNAYLTYFGITKVPLIFFCTPSVVEQNASRTEIKIPLNRRTRNHLKSMYFGTLCVGADCAAGIHAMSLIDQSGVKMSLVFKDFKGQFLKRPEADVHFACEEGDKILEMIQKAKETGERVNQLLNVVATTPSLSGAEPVAKFEMTLSIKKK
jgi:hypothetical protein